MLYLCWYFSCCLVDNSLYIFVSCSSLKRRIVHVPVISELYSCVTCKSGIDFAYYVLTLYSVDTHFKASTTDSL